MSRITNEAPTSLGIVPAILDPARRYRLVFAGRGTSLAGHVYDLGAPGLPVASVTASDASYASGLAGVLVFSDTNTAASAVFDSYSAGTGAMAPLRISGDDAGNVQVSWDWAGALCHQLESSDNLLLWTPVPDAVSVHAAAATLVQPFAGRRYFRSRSCRSKVRPGLERCPGNAQGRDGPCYTQAGAGFGKIGVGWPRGWASGRRPHLRSVSWKPGGGVAGFFSRSPPWGCIEPFPAGYTV